MLLRIGVKAETQLSFPGSSPSALRTKRKANISKIRQRPNDWAPLSPATGNVEEMFQCCPLSSCLGCAKIKEFLFWKWHHFVSFTTSTKDNEWLAIREAVHLKPNSSQLPAKSPITEANTVSHGRLRLCNRRYGGANLSWRWNARDTREEEYFRFRVIFLFRSSRLSRVLRCRLELTIMFVM